MTQDGKERIGLADGAGGEKMETLLSDHVMPFLLNDEGEIPLSSFDDSCVADDIVFTIDSHTVKPIFFPGGDLGKLSVSGTINDLLAMGSEPIGLSLAMVIPEGYPVESLEDLLESASKVLEKTDTPILTGDTKVVEKEDIDEPIFTTAGIGKRHPLMEENMMKAGGRKSRWLSDDNLNPGDKIIVTGSVGDHGITILSEREGYGFRGEVKSDVAPLDDVMKKGLSVGGIGASKDPTRGGLANTLNELADKSSLGIEIHEDRIPIKEWVSAASEMLGVDPLSIGNEGKFVLAVNSTRAKKVVNELKKTEAAEDAAIIGEVTEEIDRVVLKTGVGGKRILEKPVGDPVPRIC